MHRVERRAFSLTQPGRRKYHSITVSKTSSTILLFFVAALSGCDKNKSVSQAKADTTAAVISNKLAAIAAAGEPVSFADLSKWYIEPPPGANAAEIYTQAFAALTADDPDSAVYVSKNQKALALLLQAAGRKACRYPIDLNHGLDASLPHLPKFKNSAILLSSAANIEAGAGRTTTATKDILAGIQLSRSAENEPTMISRLVELSSLAITVRGLEQVLNRRVLSADQLLEIQNALHNAEDAASFRRVLVCERASMINSFQISPEDWAKLVGTAIDFLIDTNQGAFDLAAYKKTDVYQEDFNSALDYITALVERADKPFPEALEGGDEPKFENAVGQKFILSSAFLPAAGKALNRAAEMAARLRVAQTALGIERFRLQHTNALPGSLTELTSAFLTAVPTDPFDGQPLRFKKLPGRGYVVYSVGKDRKDDGGIAPAKDKPSSAPDTTFTIGR